MIWITASEIDNWTSREPRRAQELLPLLVEKLILASSKKINDCHFPYGKAIQYSGYDGFLEIEDSSPFYPQGKSVWEIGTNENSKEKFNNDYSKRTKEPNGFVQAETTFCFVTSRIWNHRQGIAEITEEKRKEKIWKDIRIIDANNLERWMESCPSVQMWFAKIINKPKTGIQDIISFWEDKSNSTNPNLKKEFFLYNRESVVNRIIDIFESNADKIILVAGSWFEAVLYLAAEVFNSDDDRIKSFGEKCLIVHSFESLNIIDNESENAIIIPCFNIQDLPSSVNHNKLLIPVNRFDPIDRINKSSNRIEIPQRTRNDFCEALTKLGYSPSESYNMGCDFLCNFTALYRHICTNPLTKIPEWINDNNSVQLLPALFAGAWEERYQGDKEVISELSDMSYEDYTSSIRKFTLGDNITVSLIDKSYSCISINEMWDLLWDKITEKNFNLFKNCFNKVFSEIDPTYELPEKQWHMASILGKESSYSNELKNGMILTLIMLVLRSNSVKYPQFSANIKNECLSLVNQVFESLTSLQRWQTICPYIPLLFEAAPDIVLHKLEK